MCVIVAFIIAVVFTVYVGQKIDASLNGIICAILVIPLGYVGVFQKNGMDFFEYYKEKRKNQTGENTFYYVTDFEQYKNCD